MYKPPKEYFIIKDYIDNEKMSLQGFVYFFLRIPKDFIEWLIRYLPGSVGIIIRRYYYKLVLKKVGKNVTIDEGVYFHGNNIEIDDWACIDKFSVIRCYSRLRIGKRVHIGVSVIIHAALNSEIIIDDNTGIADRCSLYSLTNSYAPNKRIGGPICKSNEVKTRSGPIIIDKDCFLGMALSFKNVKIGFVYMSSQSIIRKDIADLGISDKKSTLTTKRRFDKNIFYDE